STPGNDMNLSLEKVLANRNFANKVWNAGRFVIGAISSLPEEGPAADPDWTLADSWIWARLQSLVRDVERLFQNYQYGEAGRQIYEFLWGDFADWYIEISKIQLNQGGDRAFYTASTLGLVFDISLRLLHPFTPFITEELWGHLKKASQGSALRNRLAGWPEALIIAPWPEPRPEEGWEAKKVSDFTLVQDVVRAIRNLRSEKDVKPGMRIPAILVSYSAVDVLRQQASTIAALSSIDPDALTIIESIESKPEDHIALVVGPVEIYLPLAGLVDIEEERARLEKDLNEVQSQIDRLEVLLASQFVEKAPHPVVQKERDNLDNYQQIARKIQHQLQDIG
ncbi:MAG: class I tRNA ligase family protein, partial [Gammaproteobacteria bacterium]|nr:class I tRNA ligase family protein [Gammaproteobacteria bacterium]